MKDSRTGLRWSVSLKNSAFTTPRLKRAYWTWIPPGVLWLVLSFTAPQLGLWLIPIYTAGVLCMAWAWNLRRDWKKMYHVGMHMADKTTLLAETYARHGDIRYATFRVNDRKFPKVLWVTIVAHTDKDGITSVSVYQGWSVRNHVPEPERIVRSRIYRQVA